MIIGIISKDINDFQNWKLESDLETEKIDNIRKFDSQGSIYLCISNLSHLCSVKFDKIIETGFAKQNKSYKKIKSNIKIIH